jgi:hypothetical protein
MSWVVRMLARAARVDMTDVMAQQTGDDLLQLLKELIL